MAHVLASSRGMSKSVALIASLMAVILGVVAQPARAQQTPERSQPLSKDPLPKTTDGEWWEAARKEANTGNTLVLGLRRGVVHGCVSGFDISLMRQYPSFDDYKKHRDALMRSDLNADQVLAKVDAYYAEPGSQHAPLCAAVLSALTPPAKK
jgi:hypothetical protein